MAPDREPSTADRAATITHGCAVRVEPVRERDEPAPAIAYLPVPRSPRRLDTAIVDLVRQVGHVSVRDARMEPHRRYKIDIRDERHPVVLLNRDRDDVGEAWPEIMARLLDWSEARRRRALTVVDDVELLGYDDEDDDLDRAVGDDEGVTEVAAQRARARIFVASG